MFILLQFDRHAVWESRHDDSGCPVCSFSLLRVPCIIMPSDEGDSPAIHACFSHCVAGYFLDRPRALTDGHLGCFQVFAVTLHGSANIQKHDPGQEPCCHSLGPGCPFSSFGPLAAPSSGRHLSASASEKGPFPTAKSRGSSCFGRPLQLLPPPFPGLITLYFHHSVPFLFISLDFTSFKADAYPRKRMWSE